MQVLPAEESPWILREQKLTARLLFYRDVRSVRCIEASYVCGFLSCLSPLSPVYR